MHVSVYVRKRNCEERPSLFIQFEMYISVFIKEKEIEICTWIQKIQNLFLLLSDIQKCITAVFFPPALSKSKGKNDHKMELEKKRKAKAKETNNLTCAADLMGEHEKKRDFLFFAALQF